MISMLVLKMKINKQFQYNLKALQGIRRKRPKGLKRLKIAF